ncbi:GNAT family N-acetyltransferase [Kitasatospora terrestris]|uniref:GNAT family N-acetyltransferase n=1 Tax=Kitasatospora terrestris TaxID=258051 RepID=A0ABP9DST3_9ACTN
MDSPIVVRTGGPADAAAVATLHADSWRTAYEGIVPAEALGDGLAGERLAIWEIRLTADYGPPADTPVLLIAEEPDGTPVGFAYLVPEPDGRVLLDNLHVRPGRTGGGIGALLLRAALDRTAAAGRPLRLEVLRDNVRAVAFYEREGGVRTDERVAAFPGGHLLPEYEYLWPATT